MQAQLIAELHKPTAPPARLGLAEADDAALVEPTLAIQRKTARGAKQMELKIAGFCGETTGRQTHRSDDRLEGHRTSAATKSPSLLGWYHILRTHHQWTVFQAIRYALWLTR